MREESFGKGAAGQLENRIGSRAGRRNGNVPARMTSEMPCGGPLYFNSSRYFFEIHRQRNFFNRTAVRFCSRSGYARCFSGRVGAQRFLFLFYFSASGRKRCRRLLPPGKTLSSGLCRTAGTIQQFSYPLILFQNRKADRPSGKDRNIKSRRLQNEGAFLFLSFFARNRALLRRGERSDARQGGICNRRGSCIALSSAYRKGGCCRLRR